MPYLIHESTHAKRSRMGAAPAQRSNLASVLETNRAAYQALADDYYATSPLRLRHADSWLGVISAHARPAALGRALDIGCADGAHAYRLSKLGYDVTAVDFSPRMIELARSQRARSLDDRAPVFLEGEFLHGPFRDAEGKAAELGGPFDLVVANAFVHLFPEPTDATVVRKALGLVGHGGKALFSTTIEESRREGYFEKASSDGWSVGRWRGHYPKDEFIALVRKAAGQAFVVADQVTSDMRGKAWLTVSAQRSAQGRPDGAERDSETS